MHPSLADDEFMGMADYVMESIHDLLTRDSKTISNSDSRRVSHHPSCECFMADTPEGHVKSIHEQEVTPSANLDDMVKGDAREKPCLQVEQLRMQQRLEEAWLQLQ
jgi:hypothetical protein